MTIRTFTVITPCFQAEHLIRGTIESILGQTALRSGRVELQYVVCDGGSTDRTVDVVREVAGDRALVVSERDRGMYDAVAKGLRLATGDVVSYLNAGDEYARTAFDVVADVFESGRARWLTGMTVFLNGKGYVSRCWTPYRYRRGFIRRGLYGRRVLPFIQQESTFWARELVDTLDLERLATLSYAGDYYLWNRFSTVEDLVVVESMLGAFRFHPGQRSEAMAAYRRELASLAERPRLLDLPVAVLDRFLWYAPSPVKKWLNPDHLLTSERSAAAFR